MKYNKEVLENIVKESKSYAEVMRNLDLNPTGGNHRHISSKIRYFNIDISHFTRNKNSNFDIDEVRNTSKSVTSYSSLCEKIGIKPSTSNISKIKKFISIHEIDISHFLGRSWNKGKTKETDERVYDQWKKNRIPDSEIFVANSKYPTKKARKRIIEDKLLDYKCKTCKISTWLGKELTLHLDHINGISNDHRLNNLRFLCPNCHQQTDTWGNKKGSK